MPDSQNYNTRLRTNAQIHPPRRLRHSPSPPPRHLQTKLNAQSSELVQPNFPPPGALLHPDDAANKTFLAIGRALLAVDNRAITIKDLSQLSLDYGLLRPSASAASQAITTFIRNHLNRCRMERAKPLLLSLALTGTPADDRLAPALHSRSGGTSSILNVSDRTLTSFRRGTIVWYLSEAAGAPCPFRRAGISIDEVACSAEQGTKRKRDSRQSGPRKVSAQGPGMATRNRLPSQSSHDATSAAVATQPRFRVKLTLKLKEPSCPVSSDPDESSESDLESESDVGNQARSTSVENSDDNSSVSDLESSIHIDDSSSVCSQDLPPYPILSRSIPSPSCTTPSTSMASPSVPCSNSFSPYAVSSTLCSSHFISSSFASFRSALSNPPRDRARSSSLPFSAASPPPDSEDEDEDYHNSMVGLRRGSVPPPLKKEEAEEEDVVFSTFGAITPKYVPGSVHLAMATKTWEGGEFDCFKEESPSEDVSTPLEVLPGFVAFEHEHESGDVGVKDEPTLPRIKTESDNDQNQRSLSFWSAPGKGTKDDPVRIGDVEVLGPESVRSREWDVAWAAKEDRGDIMDVDTCVSESRPTLPMAISSGSAQIDIHSQGGEMSVVYPLRHCEPPVIATIIQGVPVYQTHIAQGVSLLRRIDNSYVNISPLIDYLKLPLSALVGRVGHTAPRISVSSLDGALGGTWVPITIVREYLEKLEGRVPRAVVNVFLDKELDSWFPGTVKNLGTERDQDLQEATARHFNALVLNDTHNHHPRGSLTTSRERSSTVVPDGVPGICHKTMKPLIYDVQASSMKDLGIRVEDVFIAPDCPDIRLKSDLYEVHVTSPRKTGGVVSNVASGAPLSFPRSSSLFCEGASLPLDEQEERLFYSFVDLVGAGCASMSMSCTSSPLTTPPGSPLPLSLTTPVKHVSASNSTREKEITLTVTTSAHQKENEAAPPVEKENTAKRRKREKMVAEPVRRSKRTRAAKAGSTAPMTRSRGRSN